jgi:hypothetical protein
MRALLSGAMAQSRSVAPTFSLFSPTDEKVSLPFPSQLVPSPASLVAAAEAMGSDLFSDAPAQEACMPNESVASRNANDDTYNFS